MTLAEGTYLFSSEEIAVGLFRIPQRGLHRWVLIVQSRLRTRLNLCKSWSDRVGCVLTASYTFSQFY